MSYLKTDSNKCIRKTAIATGVALVVGSAGFLDIASADVYEFDWTGDFVMVDSNGAGIANTSITEKGANQFQTPVTGTTTYDTAAGSGSVTIVPFQFFGGNPTLPATAKDITFESIGDGGGLNATPTLWLSNMLFDWNGTSGIPVTLAWDAAGVLGAIDDNTWDGTPLNVSDVISGTGVRPAVDGTYVGAGVSGTNAGYIDIGLTPVATTKFNTTNTPACIPGANQVEADCLEVNPSGQLPLITDTKANPNDFLVFEGSPGVSEDGIGGNPMQDGPFHGSNANFEMIAMTLTSFSDTTAPVMTLNGNPIVNLDVDDTYTEQGATCTDAIDGSIAVTPGGDTVDTSTAGTYSVTYDCEDSSFNAATQLTRTVNVTAAGVPVITLLGTTPVTHEGATPYTDAGATCNDPEDGDIAPLDGDFTPPQDFTSLSTVNENVVGAYTVTYNCTDSGGATAPPVVRDVNVVDTTKPVITLDAECPIAVEGGPDTVDPTPTATAFDTVDGDLSDQVVESGGPVDTNPVFAPGQLSTEFNLGYSGVTDAAGNTADPVACQITVGNPDPVATLIGQATVVLSSGADYVEEGATCEDFKDGDLPDATALADSPNGAIDGTTPNGSYTVTYTCTDGDANTGTTERNVIIGVAFSAASDSGSTFVMLDPLGSFVGGADDVFFSWDGSLYTDPVTQTEPNMFMGSALPQPFFGFPWEAHNIRAFGPGDYVIPTSRGNTLDLHIEPNQMGAHMLFDWNANDDIDVVLVWDLSGIFVGSTGPTDDLGSKGEIFPLASVDPVGGDGFSGISMADGPFTGFHANFNIKLTPLFILPDAVASAEQDANDPITVISSAGGDVTVTASVNPDVNGVFSYGSEGFSYDWSMSEASLLAGEIGGPSSNEIFQFNPAGLAAGPATAVVKVVDNASGMTSTVSVPLEVTAGAADPDTDADGVPDSQDINDNDVGASPTVQQGENDMLLESSAGILILGNTASAVGVSSGTYNATVSAADIGVDDPGVDTSCIGGCSSFEVTGLAKGAAVDVILPLSEAIPDGGVVRKFVNGVWRDFVTTDGNAIMSAPGAAGDCSAPGAFSAGATSGDFCLKLTIVDGGLDDADGNANGVVRDPVGVAGGAVAPPEPDLPGNIGSPSTGGCSIIAGANAQEANQHADWWLLGAFLAGLGLLRRRIWRG